MIIIILLALVILLLVAVLILILTEGSETSRLRKVVTIKQLILNEKALDMQINNTASYINSLVAGGEVEEVEETNNDDRRPVGFHQD